MSYEITVEGGTSVRLPTAGKYCDRDIVVTATGGGAAEPIIEPLAITENGTYTAPDGVDGYSPVTVNVPTGGGENLDKLIDGTITEVSSAATSVRQYALQGCTSLTSATFPNATTIGSDAFSYCTSLRSVDFPNATTIGSDAFQNCTNLRSVDFPNATMIGSNAFKYCQSLKTVDFPNVTSLNSYAFSYCTSLTSVDFPKAKNIELYSFPDCTSLTSANFPNATTIGNYAFRNCRSLTSVDFPKATSIGVNTFNGGYSLKTVIIRSDTICTLANTNSFSNCYHFLGTKNSTYNPTGAKDGYIYVPGNLVDAYKSATNWSTYASQFRAIEDYPEVTGG